MQGHGVEALVAAAAEWLTIEGASDMLNAVPSDMNGASCWRREGAKPSYALPMHY